jgi:hypothetical protein
VGAGLLGAGSAPLSDSDVVRTLATVSSDEVADGESLDDGPGVDGVDDSAVDGLDEMGEQISEIRDRLAGVPAEVVVANHAMGLYELAAIHLLRQPPAFDEASLAIDALGALMDGLPGRLGEHEETLRDALGQIRMTFVQVKASQ